MTIYSVLATPTTDPAALMRLRDSIYASDLVVAAVGHLELFSALREPKNLDELCSLLRIELRPADVMITLMKSLGLVTEIDSRLHLTATAREHLIPDSPWFLRPYISSQKSRPICRELLTVLRTGQPIPWAAANDDVEWNVAMTRPDFAEAFTGAMDSRGAYLAPALAMRLNASQRRKILDIGGASGIYASALLASNPHLSGTVLERYPVSEVARYSIQKRGLADRIGVVVGDMFEDEYPPDHDLHLYSNVLHDWDEKKVEYLIMKSYAALPEGGAIVIHDAHLNADKTGPVEVAEYSVLLMCLTNGKCYSRKELEAILLRANFKQMEVINTVANRSIIVATK